MRLTAGSRTAASRASLAPVCSRQVEPESLHRNTHLTSSTSTNLTRNRPGPAQSNGPSRDRNPVLRRMAGGETRRRVARPQANANNVPGKKAGNASTAQLNLATLQVRVNPEDHPPRPWNAALGNPIVPIGWQRRRLVRRAMPDNHPWLGAGVEPPLRAPVFAARPNASPTRDTWALVS